MALDTYEIRSGVRRAKICQLAGRLTITACIYHLDGQLLRTEDLLIEQLLSPKDVIDLTLGVGQKIQYLRMEWAAAHGVAFLPIEVQAGSCGTRIADIKVIR